MMTMHILPIRQLMRNTILTASCVLSAVACSALDVSNPTRVTEENLDNPVGVEYTLNEVRYRLGFANEEAAVDGGLLTDELFLDTFSADQGLSSLLDNRQSVLYENSLDENSSSVYLWLQNAWRVATVALPRVRQFSPPETRGVALGEIFATRGFTMVGLAEQICPGFPIRNVDISSDLKVITPRFDSPPQTTDMAFTRAVAEFDSALAYAGDSARIVNLARVGKARALLGLGRFAEAGAVAATVPDGYIALGLSQGRLYRPFRFDGYSVADREGTNGLAFVTSADARLPLTFSRHAFNGDTLTLLYAPTKYWDTQYAPFIIANDVEARLIEAEAQLQPADNPSGPWLATLNALRATAGLSDTTDPGTGPARVDLLFHERAFWLFATGHRLGDLRRLISRYGRDAETVFPTGVNRVGRTYGTATSIPFPAALERRENAAITGCTSR